MNRREFLRFAAVPVAAAIALPELARTIILPPRGGWPVDYVARYTHQAYALGFAITEPKLEGMSIEYDRGSNRLVRPAAFQRELQKGLEDVFRRYYSPEGVLMVLEDGRVGRVRHTDEWPDLFADA